MRVLHSYKIYKPDIDGGIPFAIATLARLQAEGIQNDVLVARRFGLGRTLRVDGIAVKAVSSLGTVFSTPLAPTFPPTLFSQMGGYDIVVHHAPFPLADLVLPWLPGKSALIVYWHADINRYRLLKQLLSPAIRRTLQRADRIIVADQHIIAQSELLQPHLDKCSVIPFGADIADWSTCNASEQAQSVTLRKQSPRMIVALGRLVPYKGLSVLLQAMTKLDAQLVLIGEGHLRQELEAQAATLGLSSKVTFAGRISTSEIKTYLHAARVFAFPSINSAEAFGIVQLEAMAAGLPIVNTALETAVPRIARHDIEALTVQPGDPDGLAAALQRILDDPQLATRLGQAGHQRALTEYSQATYLARIKDVYRDVIAARQHAR